MIALPNDRPPIPYGKQSVNDDDIKAVVDVLTSDYLTQGEVVGDFELALADHTQARHCCCVSSATAALHLTYIALGIRQGDMVWTSPITFVATSNTALLTGATVDFVDIDTKTGNICPIKLAEKLEIAEKEGKLPKVLTVVHFAGNCADMPTIHKLCSQFGIKIVEDASHALGGTLDDIPVGSCKYSEACIFSFHPVKIITSGEGGCITSNSFDLIKTIKRLRSHGIVKDEIDFENAAHGGWYYEQQILGLNYRLSDIHAALGLSQLKKLKKFVERRNEIASLYQEILPLELKPQTIDKHVLSSYHLFTVQTDERHTRKKLYDHLHSNNVLVQIHYMPIHTQPYYRELGFQHGQFPRAEHFYSTVLSLPIFPNLRDAQIEEIVAIIRRGLLEC